MDVTRHDSSLDLSFEGHQLRFDFVESDSAALSKPVYHLREWSLSHLDFTGARHHQRPNSDQSELGNLMLTARVPSSDLSVRHILNLLGFEFVELTLHPQVSLKNRVEPYENHFEMRAVSESEAESILLESEYAFQYSRFFRDPFVPNENAALRFREWVRSSIGAAHKNTWLFLDSLGKPLAFFIDRQYGDDRFLELTAMLEASRGLGLARKVWETYLFAKQLEGADEVKTNISAENSAVVALYPKLGFSFAMPSIAMHFHS